MIAMCFMSLITGLFLGSKYRVLSICPAGILLTILCVLTGNAEQCMLSYVSMTTGYVIQAWLVGKIVAENN